MPTPLQLNDDEMSVLMSLAGPIDQQRRPQFLQEVRRYFDPPQLPNASPVHRGSAARRLGVDKRPAGDERVGGDRRSSFTRKLDRATTPEGRAKPESGLRPSRETVPSICSLRPPRENGGVNV